MYAGMNSWCPDEPLTLVSQTRQEEEEKESLKGVLLFLHLQGLAIYTL